MNEIEINQFLKELRAEQIALRNDILGFEKSKNEVRHSTDKKLKVSWISVLLAFIIQAITVTWFLSDLTARVNNNLLELVERKQAIKSVDRIELRLQWLDKIIDKYGARIQSLERERKR